MSDRYIKFSTARSYLREACMSIGSNGGRMLTARFDNEPTIEVPSAEPESHEINYTDCVNATLKMWIDNVLTDDEYNRIMDKLNAKEMERRTDG